MLSPEEEGLQDNTPCSLALGLSGLGFRDFRAYRGFWSFGVLGFRV